MPESARRTLAPVAESRGTPVVVLEPVVIAPALPDGFVDIDTLVEQSEADPSKQQAISEGRKAVAQEYYAEEPRALAYFRLAKGWSQKQLASRLGTSQSYIARLETGEIDPQVSTLKRLAAVFDVQPSLLLDAILNGAKRT